MAEIWTSDLFKVAYLLSKGQRIYSVGFNNGEAQFIIKGEYIEMHDLRYKTGHPVKKYRLHGLETYPIE